MSDFNQERIDKAKTHIVKLVFPNTTNHYDTLFGGIALQWMDEIAYITANRFSRQEFVTVSLDRIDFQKPIPSGSLVELIGTPLRVGRTSIQIRVDVFIESMASEKREMAIQGTFTMVAVGKDRRPIPIL